MIFNIFYIQDTFQNVSNTSNELNELNELITHYKKIKNNDNDIKYNNECYYRNDCSILNNFRNLNEQQQKNNINDLICIILDYYNYKFNETMENYKTFTIENYKKYYNDIKSLLDLETINILKKKYIFISKETLSVKNEIIITNSIFTDNKSDNTKILLSNHNNIRFNNFINEFNNLLIYLILSYYNYKYNKTINKTNNNLNNTLLNEIISSTD
jgi:hypothetical protein